MCSRTSPTSPRSFWRARASAPSCWTLSLIHILRRVSDKTQFIVITQRRGTMEAANVLYGVTMQEDGVSKLLKLDLEQVDAELVS